MDITSDFNSPFGSSVPRKPAGPMSSKPVSNRKHSITMRRRSSASKSAALLNGDNPTPPHVAKKANAAMVRRRVSISQQEVEAVTAVKPLEKEVREKEEHTTTDLIKRSQSYAFDSSSEEDISSGDDMTPRVTAYENTRYMLQSFESGHWSMAGGMSNRYEDSGGKQLKLYFVMF